MKVIVDTSVWSLALRRNMPAENAVVPELLELIRELRVQMIGPIRQEILSGIRSNTQFSILRDHLQSFPDLELASCDYETAAEFYNLCRSRGVQGSNTDFLICAVAARMKIPIFTTDEDFTLFKQHLPVALHGPRAY